MMALIAESFITEKGKWNLDLKWLNNSIFHLGQDLIQHISSGNSELNGSLRLATPNITNQSPATTLTINNDQLLSQNSTLNSSSGEFSFIFFKLARLHIVI